MTATHWAEGDFGEGHATYARLEGRWHSVNGTKPIATEIRWTVSKPRVLGALLVAAVVADGIPAERPHVGVKDHEELECFCCGQTYIAGDNVPVMCAQDILDANRAVADVATSLVELLHWLQQPGPVRPNRRIIENAYERLAQLKEHCPHTL